MTGLRCFAWVAIGVLEACAVPGSLKTPTGTVEVGMNDGGVVDGGVDAGPTCGCTGWSALTNAGDVEEAALNELSGLVAARRSPGVLFAHNDSGDSARFFALSETGRALGQFVLRGATAKDWEDIAAGPCAAGSCLWLGDIGDNNFVRTDYAVYRVTEPSVDVDAGLRAPVDVPFTRFAFEYPNGAKHNAEALFAHPTTGLLYIVTKENFGPSAVYRFPELADASRTATLELVTELTVPASSDSRLTAADVSPCGDAVLMRLYNRLVEYRLPAGAAFESMFSATPVDVPYADEPQGEAVAYSADGRAYFTSSEKLTATLPLNRSVCR